MFTGIVTDIGEIAALTPTAQGQLHRLRIACRYDRSTIAAIFPSYSRDNRRVNSMVNDQIRQGIEQANQFSASIQSQVDASARTTQGFSDYLRGQSVILDTETGGHARTSDQLSDALIQANPNRIQSVPTSDYIKGLDY